MRPWKDLTGQRFGKLSVLRMVDNCRTKAGGMIWECKCDCGKVVRVASTNLLSGNTRSCGCLHCKDLTGQRFGRLVARRPTQYRMQSSVVWECECDCGEITLVPGVSLTTGNTRSCGCLFRETRRGNAQSCAAVKA